MRLSIINPFYDPAETSPIEVSGRYRHVDALAAALAHRGHEVTAIQAFHDEGTERRNGVEFRLVQTRRRSVRHLNGGFLGSTLLASGNSGALIAAASRARADAVHMNGLTLLQPLQEIGVWCAETNRPLTVSYHGGQPLRAPWLHARQRRILERCHRVFFTTRAHAEPWVQTGQLEPGQVVPCMEVSSTFVMANRTAARARTGMTGRPVFVWNARLHPVKDPLTTLKAFSVIRKRWPEARLYMIYYSSEMLDEVGQTIADFSLADSVEMRGSIAPRAVEDFFNSADFLLQSSVQEVAGYSVLEAMSCGVIPIVTDISSFRAMTDGGRIGALFPVGDHSAMAERVLRFDLPKLAPLAQEVRARFETALSYAAIAETYERAFLSGIKAEAPSAEHISFGAQGVQRLRF